MLFTEFKEYTFESELEDTIEIDWYKDVDYLFELKCVILKSNKEPLNGKYHLADLKQIRYYKNGKLYRDDNFPVAIGENGSLYYYVNGKYHRIDGPAIIYSYGDYLWYINGYRIDRKEMDNWLKENNLPLDWNIWTESDKFLFALHWSDYSGK